MSSLYKGVKGEVRDEKRNIGKIDDQVDQGVSREDGADRQECGDQEHQYTGGNGKQGNGLERRDVQNRLCRERKISRMLYQRDAIRARRVCIRRRRWAGMKKEYNVRVEDNGSVYLLVLNKGTEQRLVIGAFVSLGQAWEQIEWMYRIETQEFTVGEKKIPVTDWVEGMKKAGYLD